MPSTAYSKAKGRLWEAALCLFFRDHGFPEAERRRLAGASDKGDVAGLPYLAGEAKHERTYKLGEWVREAEREAINAKVPWGVVFARQNGKPEVGDGFAIMSIRQFALLYGDYLRLKRGRG